MNFLTRVRSKPPHVRTRYAFLSALMVTLVIAGIWSTTLPARLSTIGTTIDNIADTESVLDEVKENTANVIDAVPTDESVTNEASPTAGGVYEDVVPMTAQGGEAVPVADTGSSAEHGAAILEATSTTETVGETVILIGTTTTQKDE